MKLPHKHTIMILGLSSLVTLYGCESPQTPPPTTPPPTMPPPSAPPSQPSSSPPSEPSSSPPSEPSSSPSQPPSEPSTQASSPGDASSSSSSPQKDSKSQAAEEALAKAGEQLSKAGETLQIPKPASPSGESGQEQQSASASADQQSSEQSSPSSSGEPSFPDDQEIQAASSQPSFPDDPEDQSAQSAASEPSFPDDQSTQASSSDASVSDAQSAQESGAESSSDSAQESQQSGDPQDQASEQEGEPEGSPPGAESEAGFPDQEQLAAEIQAIKDAILEAGGALQTASETMSDAQQTGDNQTVEGALAEARVAVIIADQELQGIRDDNLVSDVLMEQLEEALNNANIAIVLAGRVLQESGTEFPEMQGPDGDIVTGGQAGGKLRTLEDELNDSLIVFEGHLRDAKDSLPEQEGESRGGTIDGETEAGELMPTSEADQILTGANDAQAEMDEPGTVAQTGRMPGPGEKAVEGSPPPDPDDIPDGQDDDIVARQLREAATSEQDPDLKEKLWEEYKKYKTGISR